MYIVVLKFLSNNEYEKLDSDSSVRLNSYFILGFCDAESTFVISIRRNNKMKTGWLIEIIFLIGLHKKDRALLERIKSFFGVGFIRNHGKDAVAYRVSSIKDLEIIIDHFDKFPLITQKWVDYQLLKQVAPPAPPAPSGLN
jgi:hypothetical protein